MSISKIKFGNTTESIKDANAYVKPSGGIPESDLASDVQSSIGRIKTTTKTDQTFTFRQTANGTLDFDGDAMVLESVKGNTVVWNQSCQYLRDVNTSTLYASSEILSITSNTIIDTSTMSTYAGHKYYISFTYYCDSSFSGNVTLRVYFVSSMGSISIVPTTTKQIFSGIYTADRNNSVNIIVTNYTNGTFSYGKLDCVDLTLMFGAGNEPTSVTEFEALFHNGYYSYDSGRLLSLTSTTIKTDGPQLWDEELEIGGINGTTGQNETSASNSRSKNYIPISPTTTYYVSAVVYKYFYDANKNFISYDNSGSLSFISPANARYLRFRQTTADLPEHITINLSNPAINGTYFPYDANYLPVDITELTSNGVKVCPDGLLSAGSVYDEIVGNKLIKRVGTVHLGDLTYKKMDNSSGGHAFISTSNDGIDAKPMSGYYSCGCTCSKYSSSSRSAESNMADKTVAVDRWTSASGFVNIIDSSYSNSSDANLATFKASLNGVYLNYELATPIEYTLDETPIWTTKINRYGTESIYPQNGEIPYTAPFRADIQYGATTGDLAGNINNLATQYKDYTKTEDQDGQEFLFRKSGSEWADTGLLKAIKGKTLVWNQLISKKSDSVTFSSDTLYLEFPFSATKSHKYYFSAKISYVGASCIYGISAGDEYISGDVVPVNPSGITKGIINNVYDNILKVNIRNGSPASGDSISADNVFLVDLTLMFGSGNEPTTVAEFEKYYNALYYPYNAGELKSVEAKEMESTGRNVWDEEWENGVYSGSGVKRNESSDNNRIRCKNYIPILPGTTYYRNLANTYLRFYDANKQFISTNDTAVVGEFTTPANACFLTFCMAATYGNTYLHDICINISDPDFNGKYVPYKESVLPLNLDAIKVKSPNIWDEEWENGYWNTSGFYVQPNYIASKNYIPVTPSTSYYLTTYNQLDVTFFDSGKSGISKSTIYGAFTTPADCYYIAINTHNSGVTTYNHDICINLSQSGINGKYFPHGTLTFSGLKSAGSVYDEIKNGKLYRRVGRQDLGELIWNYSDGVFYKNNFSVAKYPSSNNLIANIVGSRYLAVSDSSVLATDKSTSLGSGGQLVIHDSAYTDATTFATAMSGVMLNYELATEEVYELAFPLLYANFPEGTERFTYDSIPAIPVPCDIQYGSTKQDIAHAIDENSDRIFKLKTEVDGKYHMPTGGVPKSDLESAVQTSLGKADTAYQKPSGGIPATDLATTVQASLGKADSALQAVAVETTWANLKSLRDNSQLIKGMQYRITDFVTTTAQTNTQSAGHAFDLIVVADETNKLNEKARAALHSGDTYFANSKLEAWEIWYCLDNDTTRFAWADSTDGKGVIWFMRDEHRNECYYDFKNIMFKHGASQTGTVANVFYYTFSVATGTNDATVTDRTLNGGCYGNKIGVYFSTSKQTLSDNVFRSTGSFSNCYGNTLGDSCYSNTFGNGCYSNTLGDSCYSNTFGDYCSSNTFGKGCPNNTFGNSCTNNTFGISCYANTFGDYCSFNTFGNYCSYIKFGNSQTVRSYYRFIIVENGNQYIRLYCSDTTSYNTYFQNVKIAQGVHNTNGYKDITDANVGQTYRTVYQPANSQTISV